jgi:vancomycin resistance protein VanJ
VTRFFGFVRHGLIFLVNIYLVGLAGYLLLRLIFGDQFWWLALLNNFVPFYFLPLFLLLPLVLILRAKRTTAFTLIFSVIGLAWFGPRFLPKIQAAPEGETLRLVTFNVWGNNPQLSQVETWIRGTNADVILLQEVPDKYRSSGIDELHDLYPHQFIRGGAWGNMILSRHPILSADNLDMENDGTETQQRFTIQISNRIIAIYNVHFLMPLGEQPRFIPPIDHFAARMVAAYDDTARNKQIRELLKFLANEQYPVVIGGDFNMSDQSMIYREIATHLNDSFSEQGNSLGGSWPLSVANELPSFLPPLIRIDYIWHSDEFQAVRAEQGPRLGSDHIPLVADLVLTQ